MEKRGHKVVGAECAWTLLAPMAAALVGLVFFILRRKSFRRFSDYRVLILAFGIPALLIFGGARHFQFHQQLVALDATQITSIQVGDRRFTQPGEIAKLVDALRSSQWFENNHSGWTTLVPVIVKFKSDKQLRLNVAYYLKREGAVVFSSDNGGAHPMDFSANLPVALSSLGVDLPIDESDRARYGKR